MKSNIPRRWGAHPCSLLQYLVFSIQYSAIECNTRVRHDGRIGKGTHRDSKEEVWRMPTSGCKASEEVGVEYGRLSRSGPWKKQGNGRADVSWGTGLDEEVAIATDLVCWAKHPRFIIQGWLGVWRVSLQETLFWRHSCMCRIQECSWGWGQEFSYGTKANSVGEMWSPATKVQRLKERPKSGRRWDTEPAFFGSDFVRWFWDEHRVQGESLIK